MKILLADKDKKKDNYLGENNTQEVDSLGNPLTQEQINYFRNSKVRDRQGNLLVCIHYTNNEFDTFDKSYLGSGAGTDFGEGFYFSAIDKDWYGDIKMECHLNITNPYHLDVWSDSGRKEFFKLIKRYVNQEDIDYYTENGSKIVDSLGGAGFINEFIGQDTITNLCVESGYDGIIVGDMSDGEIIAFEPNQIKSITNTNPTNSNNINEDLTLYRVGDVKSGGFFTDNLDYYSQSMTGYKKEEAKTYTIDLSMAKVFDPMKELSLYPNTWSDIEGKVEDFEKYNIDYESDSEEAIWGRTSTDDIAYATKDLGYDVLILRDIRGDYGTGKPFNEYVIYNTDLLKPVDNINEELLSESLHRLDSNCFITDSPYDIKNLLLNKPKLYRILYDANIDMYMIGDGREIIHHDLLEKAFELGYYAELETDKNFHNIIRTYAISKLPRAYGSGGVRGIYNDIGNSLVCGPYLIYMVFSPDERGFFLGLDGYDDVLEFNFGSLFLRDADQGLVNNCDLIRLLQKHSWANESMNLNESFQDEKAVREFARECIEDGLPFMDYKEFAELLSEQGMTANKDLFQIYTDEYKNMDGGYDDELEIVDKIVDEFKKMSTEQIVKLVNIPHGEQIDPDSPMFILPNGIIVSVKEVGENLGYDLSWIHGDMLHIILNTIAEKLGLYYPSEMEDLEDDLLEHLTYKLGWVRINCGTTWTEDRFYCVLPGTMTNPQFRSLEKWIEWGYDNHKGDDEVLIFFEHTIRSYEFKGHFPEDIIKKIKRYYSSGRLYENLLTEELINIDVNEAEQIATPYVSPTPTYQSWIDTKGRFIDASNLGSHYNLIDEIFWQLSDRGKYQNTKPYELSDTEYNKMTDDILDSFAPIGWIQIGLDCQWAGIFRKPNNSQYQSLEEYLDYASHKGVSEFSVNVSTDSDFATASYNLKEVTPEYVVGRIKRFFASGRLYENRNELKENMDITKEQYDEFFTYIDDIVKILKSLGGDIDDIDGYVNEENFSASFYSNINKKDSIGYSKKVESRLIKYFETKTRFNQWVEVYVTPADKFFYSLMDSNLDSYVISITARDNGYEPYKNNKTKQETMSEEFVNELIPGELYHFIHNNKILYGTFKRKTPAWLFFDVEGKEVLAKPWTSVATTTEELEELIGLVDKMEKDTKIPPQVPNRFTRVPNQHGKPMGESNELEQRAKKHKKKSKGMGWHMSMNAGDVEKGIEVFNNSTSLGSGTSGAGEGTSMGEAVEKHWYYYDGPIYYRGSRISNSSNIYTKARSFEEAARNVLYRAANGDIEDLYHFDIVDDEIKQMPDEKPERPKCQQCGYEINDNGDCPVCDYGEDDLLESLSDLEALWTLRNLD